AFRGGVWTNLTNASAPPPSDAAGGAMTWDGADGYLLLYLNCSSGCGQPETWSYLGGNWSKITTTAAPGARDGASMVYDALDGYVVFFGGSGPGDRNAQDTWEYRLDAWSNRSSIAGVSPEGGVPAGMGFDVSATSVFLVEGHRVVCGATGCVPSPVEGTWTYASNTWRNLTSSLSVAPPRGGTTFAYDPLLHSSVLMGIPGAPGAGETWTVQEQLPPLAATPPTVAPAEVDVGTSAFFSTTASGGSGLYGYAWSGLPPGCASQNMSSIPCTPGAPGNFSVLVNVTDSAGHLVQEGPLPLTVHSLPVIASLRASRYQDTVGAAISWTATVSGGAGSGTFTWSGLPTPCQGSSTNVEVCVPDTAGSFAVRVNFTDLAGARTGASLPLTVNPPPAIASFTAQPSPNASVGASLTLVLRATGGTGALSFNYSGLPQGCLSLNTSSLGCTPQQAGTFWVHATARDQDGKEVNATLPLVLSGATGSSAGPFGPYGGVVYAILGLGVLVVVLSTLVLYLRRRSSRLPPTPPSLEAAGVPPSDAPPPLGQVDEAPSVASVMPPGEEEHADATQKPSPRRPAVVRPPPTAEGPVGAPDSMCVICGGQGQIDETTGKYYCPRCDRRY
ncbi:MAG: hypothetical protein KGI89_12795, partial [Euryarchaeota archaeon]|nr:hypothetical protein [Euryarchaeota archaeon]